MHLGLRLATPSPANQRSRLRAANRRAYSAPVSRFAYAACCLLLSLNFAGCKRSGTESVNQMAATEPVEATAGGKSLPDQFISLMNAGKNLLDQGDATNALATYKRAEAIIPNDVDLRLNLANAYLLNGAGAETIRETD